MYPNSQQPQYSVDYLNQIAPPQPKSGLPKHGKLIGVILALMLLLSVGIFIYGTVTSTEEVSASDLALKLKTLELVARDSQEDLTSGELRSINSNLTIALTNASRDVGSFLGEDGAKGLEKLAKENPDDDKLRERLTDAELNAVMARTYPREMAYELDVILLMIDMLEKEYTDQEFIAFLDKTRDDIEPIYETLAEFNQG